MVIKKNISGELGVIKFNVSCNYYKECEKISKEMEELEFKNINKRKSGKKSFQIYGEYKYSNDEDKIKKLNELKVSEKLKLVIV